MQKGSDTDPRRLLLDLVAHVEKLGPGRAIPGLDIAEPGAFRQACLNYLLDGAVVELLRNAVVLAALHDRCGAPTSPNHLLDQALGNERSVRLWREAAGINDERSFWEALPDLFHPADLRRKPSGRKPVDPLWRWEHFAGNPVALDAPSVREALAGLWRAALLGEAWPLPSLRRFAAAWTFADRPSEAAVSAEKARVNEALVSERDSLAAYLEAVWREIAHGKASERSIRAAFQKAAEEGRVGRWSLSFVPRTGERWARFGFQDVDAVRVLAAVVVGRRGRGPVPWKRVALEALEPYYGEQSSSAAPVDRARKRKKTPGLKR